MIFHHTDRCAGARVSRTADQGRRLSESSFNRRAAQLYQVSEYVSVTTIHSTATTGSAGTPTTLIYVFKSKVRLSYLIFVLLWCPIISFLPICAIVNIYHLVNEASWTFPFYRIDNVLPRRYHESSFF